METSLDFTDAWLSVRSLFKADIDVVNVPRTVRNITLANRSSKQVYIKRTNSTNTPTVSEGFRLDPELTGIWYITLSDVDLDTTFIKSVLSSQTGEVDVSIEI